MRVLVWNDNPKTTVGCSWLNRENDDPNVSEVTWSNAGGTYISEDEVTQSFSLSHPTSKWTSPICLRNGLVM